MKTGGESWALLSPEGTYYKLSEPNFFVGREDDMDLTLKSRSVDKQHAVISVNTENRDYKLHDLGTLNGTFVNDMRIKQQPVNLKLRDNIRFGYVSCEEKILYGPKWISIEKTDTLCDVLRTATGDKYLTRKLKVVVASEKSLRDLSFVKLGVPVVVLDKNDKKVISFLLKPEEAVVTMCPQRKRQPSFEDERQDFNGNNTHSLETVWESNRSQSQPVPERKLSIQSSAYQTNSDEDDHRSRTPDQEFRNMYHGVHSAHSPGHSQFHPYPHYPYMTPMYHHPPPVMCHCPSCTGHRSPVHSPQGVHHQMGPHAGWTHAPPTAFQVRPRLQRPMSVPAEKFEMIVKGSPLYGQPPWWGWGSSDDEIYNYPNTATIVEGTSQGGQEALSLKKKKLTKQEALEMAQRRHSIGTVSVLSESKARIVTTRTSKTTFDPEQDRAMKQREEFVVFQKKSALPSPGYSDQLSPVFENSTSRDWEMPNSHRENAERDSSRAECDSSLENSPDDSSELHPRPAYEIPFVPDYDEIPERPVSQKSDRGKQATQDDVRKSAVEKQDRITRKKPTSKIKKKVTASDGTPKNGKTSSVSRKHSSDTSESECEASSHPSRRLGVVTRGTPSSSRVFGLTEVSLQRGSDGGSRENLSPAPLPNWVQQWASSTDTRGNSLVHQPIEVLGSSSATEDSTTGSSVMSSSSHIPVPVQLDDSEDKSKPAKAGTSPGYVSRPKSATARINSPSVMRSQSLSPASLSSSPKATSSSRVTRSKTMSAAVNRRSGTGNESDRKTTESARRAGLVSSTSDDSDVESSDTSLTRQTKDPRRKSDESERKGGVQLIPEKEGKRPLSAPRPNKTAMLRAHNSRGAVKNSGVKNKTPSAVKSRTAKNSPPSNTGNGSGVAANHTSDSSPSARIWTPSAKSSTKSSTGDDNLGGTGVSSVGNDDVTHGEVEELFSSGPIHPLPESFQMKRDDTVNKTFVLDEGKGDTSVSSPEESSSQTWVDKFPSSENLPERKETPDKNTTPTSPSRKDPAEIKLESTSTRGISLRSKLIPFAPFVDTPPYTPPVPDQPFEPPSDSADDMSGGSRSSTGEGRSMSPDSVVSAAPATSPSPPLTPDSAAKKMFDFKGGLASSQSRRQWGVTDKPVEDLMLSSIHAFSVELRLASESVLSKVKTLYDGSEELNGSTRSRTDSDSKQEPQSAIPDWKSSHAEIAGIFRNLRKVELRLRTMEQALSIMCVAAQRAPKQSFQERKLSMIDSSSLVSGQKWREFKIRARRNSWAVEHRNQFPVPPAESDEEDEDTP